MLARRIIAVSPDKAFGKQLVIALKAAGGAVDLHPTVEELGTGDLQAALVVLHLEGELASAGPAIVQRLTSDTRVVAILPRTNLAAVVDIMQSSDRVSGMLVAPEGANRSDFDPRLLSAMAARVLNGDIFGLDKLILWGTQIHSHLVGDYQEKSLCIGQISEFAELMGVRRKYRESIEQCVDEMLMNALYDAPVDEQGKQIFSEIPTKTRISLRVEQKVVVQYACDGKQFAVSVRDAFGTLERSTVLRYLHKCLHNEQQIDRKAGGAGLGLYLMTNSSSQVYFNVLPGVATEAVCVFDLETPKLQLESFGFFHEKIDAAGRLASGPSRRLPVGFPVERRRSGDRAADRPPPSKGIIALLVGLIAVCALLIGVAAWPRLTGSGGKKVTKVTVHTQPPGALVEIEGKNAGTATNGTLVINDLEVGRAYPIVARLDGYQTRSSVVQPSKDGGEITLALEALAATVSLDTTPPGAEVIVDGTSLGTTPLTITKLAPGTNIDLTFKKAGYQTASAKFEVPGPGKETRLIQPLSVSDELARVKLTSEPPGAQVIENGQLLAGVTTPAEVLVEAGKPVHFTLTLPHKVPVVIETFTPARGADNITRTGKLLDGASLDITSNLDNGKVTVAGAAQCSGPTPMNCMVGPGNFTVDFMAPGVHTTKKVSAGKAETIVKFEYGTIEAPAGKTLQIGGAKVKKTTIEVGVHTVTVVDEDGTHEAKVLVAVGKTVVAT